MKIFDPHPIEIARKYPIVSRPFIAFETPGMFEAETRKLLLSFATAANKENQDAIIKESMQEFVNLRHQNPGTLLGLYYLIMQSYGREGNADYYSYEDPRQGTVARKIFDPETGYSALVDGAAISFTMRWISHRMFDRAVSQLHQLYPEMNQIQVPKKVESLFHPSLISGTPDLEEFSMYGIIDITLEELDDMGNDSDEYYEQLHDEHMIKLDDMHETLFEIRDALVHDESEEEPVKTTRKRVKKPAPKQEQTLKEIATKIILEKDSRSDTEKEKFNVSWMMPPPITLIEMYSFEKLKASEAAFFVDAFLDLHQSETYLLAMHFVIRRLIELWKRNPGVIIEESMFSGENKLLLEILGFLNKKVPTLFASRFLAMEGVTVLGERILQQIETLFPNTSRKGNFLLPIDSVTFYSKILDIIRDGCVCLERLRVSMLYGPEHPSYVGDAFLEVYFSLLYQTRYAQTAYETILAVIEPLGSLGLPNDNIKTRESYKTIQKRFPEEVQKIGIVEVEARTNYIQDGSSRRSVNESGPIDPINSRTNVGLEILDLQRNIWSHPKTLEEVTPEVAI